MTMTIDLIKMLIGGAIFTIGGIIGSWISWDVIFKNKFTSIEEEKGKKKIKFLIYLYLIGVVFSYLIQLVGIGERLPNSIFAGPFLITIIWLFLILFHLSNAIYIKPIREKIGIHLISWYITLFLGALATNWYLLMY